MNRFALASYGARFCPLGMGNAMPAEDVIETIADALCDPLSTRALLLSGSYGNGKPMHTVALTWSWYQNTDQSTTSRLHEKRQRS